MLLNVSELLRYDQSVALTITVNHIMDFILSDSVLYRTRRYKMETTIFILLNCDRDEGFSCFVLCSSCEMLGLTRFPFFLCSLFILQFSLRICYFNLSID